MKNSEAAPVAPARNPGSATIRVEKVSRKYGPVLAVDRVSFEIASGEAVGFLGPNGAGKSTLLKMISTWLPPSSGRIEVAGHDTELEPLEVRRVLGYLPEHNALYENMRVHRFLVFMGRMRGLDREGVDRQLEWVTNKCDLRAVLGKRISQCSKGYRQRIGLAAALIHNPPVILLDEPTHGLDPLQVSAFREFIAELRPGRAILFSSHILAEVAAICDRLLIIHHGRLAADTTVRKLRERAAKDPVGLEGAVLDILRNAGATP